MRRGLVAALAASAMLLSGCVVAPIAAAGGIAAAYKARQKRKLVRRIAPAPVAQPVVPVAPPAPTLASPAPSGMQFLYGSGEAAALSMQAYQGLYAYLHMQAGFRRSKLEIASVLLARDGTLAAPHFATCGAKPLAAVFDVDETVLLNLGFEASDALRAGPYDEARWSRWEATGTGSKVAAVPGAAETLAAARRDGITIVFNTNRSQANAAGTIAALESAGLGPAKLGETLWLKPEGAGSGKDERRWTIADRYCVIALVGDQLGDFSDLFNAPGMTPALRRNAASATMIAPLWGAGWFVLPNPVYGTGLKGTIGEVFPPDVRWTDPMEGK